MLAALERVTLAATRALSVVGLVALMGLAAMTLADGLLRWVANHPIEGVRDLGGLAIAVAIACCLPVGLMERANIAIRLGRGLIGRGLEAFASTAVCIALALAAWQFWLYAEKMARARETTFVLQIPIAPFWYGVDAILWLAVLVQAIVALRDWVQIFDDAA
jgi:TRAP-type C4-dicarboxylate transport system permease small subunit